MSEWGNLFRLISERPPAEYIGWWADYPVNWNILVAGGKEKNKALFIEARIFESADSIKRVDSLSSGERKGRSLNLLNRVFCQFIGGELKDLGPDVY